VGWLWYLGTLVPVLGLIAFGAQARADRYTYIPLTGVLIMLAWGLANLVGERPRGAEITGIVALAAVAACVFASATQASYWHDSITLFRHTIEVSPNNYLGYNNLGVALSQAGRLDEAMEC